MREAITGNGKIDREPEENPISGKPRRPWETSGLLLGRQQSASSLFLLGPVNHKCPPRRTNHQDWERRLSGSTCELSESRQRSGHSNRPSIWRQRRFLGSVWLISQKARQLSIFLPSPIIEVPMPHPMISRGLFSQYLFREVKIIIKRKIKLEVVGCITRSKWSDGSSGCKSKDSSNRLRRASPSSSCTIV